MTSPKRTRVAIGHRLFTSSTCQLFIVLATLLHCSLTQAAFVAIPNVSATKDLSCLSQRTGSGFNCTAKEFTVNTAFSAAAGTPPFCMAGQEFEFIVDVELSGSNADRYDIGFFVGQTGNDPANSSAGQLCSVATFPTSPSPWAALNSNACGDYLSAGETINTIDKIKVVCATDTTTNTLQIPYVLTYVQNAGGICNGPSDVKTDTGSKCKSGSASVSGVKAVQVGVWMDVTKATIPSSSNQSFTYTASAPSGYKVIALTGATSLTTTGTSGGTYTPASIELATNTTTFSLKNGETARVFMTVASDGSAQPLTVTETAQSGWDPTATISCTGPATSNNNTRMMTASLSAAAPSAACTITNTKRPTITMKKISIGDVGSFTFTGTNTWASQTLTTTASNTEVTGSTQVLPQYVETTIAETNISSFRLDDLSCIVAGSPVAYGSTSYDFQSSYQAVTFDSNVMSPGADIICTSTSVRRRTLQVIKVLNPTIDAGKFVLAMQYDHVGINTGNTQTVSSEIGGHNTNVSATVDVTGNMVVSEAVGDTSTNMANYSPSISCNTSPVTSSTGSTSLAFVMPNLDVLCTFTNIRKSASLVLKKQWQVGIPGDTATISSSGFINNGTSGAVVADSTGNNLGSGTAFTVYSGESGTIAETFNVGTANNYNSSIACTGTNGLSGAILTVQPIDTAIQCIITNARKSANLTVRKQWINSDPGTQVNVQSNGMINTAYSGNSSSGGNTLTTGTSVKAYVTEQGTFSETYNSGSASNFVSSVTCTGTSGFDSSTGTLTVNVADTDIICTYTNQAKKPVITVTKNTAVVRDPLNGTNNPKNIPGAVVAYNIEVVNSGPGAVDANTLVISDVIPNNVKLFVGDAGGGSPVSFTDGAISSGLGWVYSDLSNGTDSVDFSNDGGISWNYVPTPDADGYDNNVSHIRFKPTGAMNASSGTNYPSFKVRFLVGVK